MSSSMITNRIRIKTEAQVVKVQQQNRQAVSYVPIQSTLGCNPSYANIKYPWVCPYQCGRTQ